MTAEIRNLSKRQKKKLEKPSLPCLEIQQIKPKTKNQDKTFTAYIEGQNIFMYGVAGTGKSFIPLYLGIKDIMSGLSSYERVVIVRSIVPSRDIGFLPGNSKEKCKEYEVPYEQICAELFERADAYSLLKSKGMVVFTSTSFNRSITFNDSIIFVDECQNMTARELDTIITRVGKNCRIIFSGDMRQVDLNKRNDLSGLRDFIKIIQKMNSFTFVEFGIDDILRSKFVKEYITTRMILEDNGTIETLV